MWKTFPVKGDGCKECNSKVLYFSRPRGYLNCECPLKREIFSRLDRGVVQMTMEEWLKEQWDEASDLEEFYRVLIEAKDIIAQSMMDGFAIHGFDVLSLDDEMQEELKAKGSLEEV